MTINESAENMLDLQEAWLKQVLGDLGPDKARSFAKIIGDISEKAKNVSINL